MRRAVLAALVLAATMWFVASGPPAAACSCPAPTTDPPDIEHEAGADAVFVGTAVDEELGATEGVYVFDVDVVVKGDVSDPVEVVTIAAANNSCAYAFPLGEPLKVYLRQRDDGRWSSGLCSGNRPATEADYVTTTSTAPPTSASTTSTTSTTEPTTTTPTTEPSTTASTASTSTSVSASTTTDDSTPTTERAVVTVTDDDDGGGGAGRAIAGVGAATLAAGVGLGVLRLRRRLAASP